MLKGEKSTLVICGVTLVLALLILRPYILQAQPPIEEISVTYASILRAHQAGANTTLLTSQLNRIVDLVLNRGERIDSRRLTEIREEAAMLEKLAYEEAFRTRLTMLLSIGILVFLIAAAYYYLLVKGGIWRIWLMVRGKHALVVRERKANRSSIWLDDEVRAVIAAILVISVIFAITMNISINKVPEPFSELGILGKNMKLADYPEELTVGETAQLYIYVGNYMGRPMFYRAEAKLGNKSSPVDPSPASPFWTHYFLLEHNHSTIIPLQFAVNRSGSYRLIVELWAYNETEGDFQYLKKWVQLWIDVSNP